MGLERSAERRARLCPALNEVRRAAAGTRTRLLSISNNFGEVEMLQTSICARTPAGNGPGWTGTRTERLKKLWADGHSASGIAALLGEVTRNAVIGKVHRLGLAGRATTSRKPRPRRTSPRRNGAGRVELRRQPPRLPARPMPPDDLPPAPAALMLSVARLTDATCHWPIGDPRAPGFGFCGAKTASGRQPYCAHHQAAGHNRGRA